MTFVRRYNSFSFIAHLGSLFAVLTDGGLLCISAVSALNVCLLVGQGNPGQGPDQDYGFPLRGWHAENQEWIQEEIWKISLLFHPGKFFSSFISWAFAAVSTGFMVPLEFMRGVLEAAVRVLYHLCTMEKPAFIFTVCSWYSSWQPHDSYRQALCNQLMCSEGKFCSPVPILRSKEKAIVLWYRNENRASKLLLPFISVLKEKAL